MTCKNFFLGIYVLYDFWEKKCGFALKNLGGCLLYTWMLLIHKIFDFSNNINVSILITDCNMECRSSTDR